jgi:tRNA(fMet)-specific endonuclease VapC
VIILDTDILSTLLRQSGAAYDRIARRLRDVEEAGEEFAASIVTVEELLRGWLSYIAASRQMSREVESYARLHALVESFSDYPILQFDDVAAAEYQALRSKKLRVGAMDLKVAAVAKRHAAPLATANMRDFRVVPGLRLLDWS